MAVDKCKFNETAIYFILFLNCVEVRQTSKFARTSATFCHTMSHTLAAFGKWGRCTEPRHFAPSLSHVADKPVALQRELESLESRHAPVTLRSLRE